MDILSKIPTDKSSRVVDAMKGIYNIPKIENPDFDDKKEESEINKKIINEFTNDAWVKESVHRFIKRTVKRHEQKVAQDAINIPEDDTLVS